VVPGGRHGGAVGVHRQGAADRQVTGGRGGGQSVASLLQEAQQGLHGRAGLDAYGRGARLSARVAERHRGEVADVDQHDAVGALGAGGQGQR
jgi:hypothetical protein